MYLSISEVTKKKEKQNENVTVFINQKKKRKEKYFERWMFLAVFMALG